MNGSAEGTLGGLTWREVSRIVREEGVAKSYPGVGLINGQESEEQDCDDEHIEEQVRAVSCAVLL